MHINFGKVLKAVFGGTKAEVVQRVLALAHEFVARERNDVLEAYDKGTAKVMAEAGDTMLGERALHIIEGEMRTVFGEALGHQVNIVLEHNKGAVEGFIGHHLSKAELQPKLAKLREIIATVHFEHGHLVLNVED